MESKLLLDSLLECLTLLEGQRIRLGNDWNNVDDIGKLLEHNNIDWLQGVARWLDEEQATVNAGVLDIALSLSSELLAEICGVLVLDVLDNWVPASVVVDLIAVTWSVDNVQAKTNAVLLNDVRNSLDLGGSANLLGWGETTLGVDEVGCEDGVDEGGLSKTSLACIEAIVSFVYLQ